MKAFVQHQYNESDKLVLQALVPFEDINTKAIFTQKDLSNVVFTDKKLSDVQGNADYYQRRLDYKRLLEIKKYIYNSILDEKEYISVSALFPSSMILAIEKEELPTENDGIVDLVFEKNDRLFIVDGQHRLMAMRLLYEDLSNSLRLSDDEEYIYQYLKNYKFSCTILVNYDLWEQGQVFVNVNFKQKPVNRSLYYDVFGAEYIESDNPKHLERNKIYLAHELTRFMNETPNSPFHKNIKMLGTGKGYISQAFFVEALLRLFRFNEIWYFDNKSLYFNENLLNYYKSELLNYFFTIADSFKNYWRTLNNKTHFICKTTGVGAFIRLMSDLHNQLDDIIIHKLRNIKPGELCPEYVSCLKNLISPIIDKQTVLFGDDKRFSGGGKGSEAVLYKEMSAMISQTEKSNEETKSNSTDVLSILRNWVSNKAIEELGKFGVKEDQFGDDLLNYLQKNIPVEIKALGANSNVIAVSGDNLFSKVISSSSDDISVAGSFFCKVKISGDNDENSFEETFPGIFTIHYKKNDNKCFIENDGTKIFINTDSHYR